MEELSVWIRGELTLDERLELRPRVGKEGGHHARDLLLLGRRTEAFDIDLEVMLQLERGRVALFGFASESLEHDSD